MISDGQTCHIGEGTAVVKMEVTDNDGVNVFRQGFVNSNEVEIGKSTVILENCQCIHGIFFDFRLTSSWQDVSSGQKAVLGFHLCIAHFGKNAFESVSQICDHFSFRDQTYM